VSEKVKFLRKQITTMSLTPSYWSERYQSDNTPWDIGQVSPTLKHFIDALDKDTRILIPGAGSAYEAVYMHVMAFTEVYVCDWAEEAFEFLRKQAPSFPATHQLVADFFELDLQVAQMLEQTFFCAIDPTLRPRYVDKAADLLVDGGHLSGVLFDRNFDHEGPPFGGSQAEYRELFSKRFEVLRLEESPYSIPPRAGSEALIHLRKK